IEQAIKYLTALHACFRELGAATGRPYRVRHRYQRQGKHVVFFRIESNGRVVIIRILHERMLPSKHLR
ncbi:MAG TPA: type II toxin-antitoxin system RelE/ParE family toxin, partial [Polyangiaceae bacterium]|nr:type II toxin-antitoxin system RelE/ParE family toxin [Polyangiaceae bacterium]